MSDLISENWKMLPGLLLGAFVVGLVSMIFVREGIRKWLLNGNTPQQQALIRVCMTTEEHAALCEDKWEIHEKQSQERWEHNNEIVAKNNELLLTQIDHLKEGQNEVKVTMHRILNKVNGGR